VPPGTWVRRAYMPTLRSELAAAVLGDRIYTAGGYVETPSGLQSSAAFEVYDPAANEWARLAPLPLPLNHPQMAAWGSSIYLFGGYPGCAGCEDSGAAWRYDPGADAWAEIAPMPDWRAGGAAVALGDHIYVVGGEGGEVRSGAVSTLVRYDPAANTWAQLAPLPQPRDHVAAVAWDGKVVALGGRWGRDLNTLVSYDPATNTWTAGRAMRDARAGFAAAVVGDRLFVAGGELVSGPVAAIVTTAEVYDPATNTWVERFNLPIGLHGVPGASVGGVFYLLGGSTLPGDVSNNGAVWAYHP
jgi:N-acetylneuraminic acid mutarotase